jgi:hypothetical protein
MMSDEDLASISENCSPVWKAVARELIAARKDLPTRSCCVQELEARP